MTSNSLQHDATHKPEGVRTQSCLFSNKRHSNHSCKQMKIKALLYRFHNAAFFRSSHLPQESGPGTRCQIIPSLMGSQLLLSDFSSLSSLCPYFVSSGSCQRKRMYQLEISSVPISETFINGYKLVCNEETYESIYN